MFSDHALVSFICLPSIVSITGNFGQTSYAGSNAFLDTYCQACNRQGLPTMAINLPVISKIGYVAEAIAAGTGRAKESYYAAAISQSQLRSVLEATTSVQDDKTAGGQVVIGLTTLLDRTQMYNCAGPLLSPWHRDIEAKIAAPAASLESGQTTKVGLKHSLAGMDMTREADQEISNASIANKISSMLMVLREDVRPDLSLGDHGLDLFLAVELRNWLVRGLGISIPVIGIADCSSVRNLSDLVAVRMAT
jgi:hypothetical protein